MADDRVIDYAGRTLVKVISDHLDALYGTDSVEVFRASPVGFTNLDGRRKPLVTLFLYQVSEHAEFRNRPFRTLADGTRVRPPLALQLHYLVTVWGSRTDGEATTEFAATEAEHRLMGGVLQALYSASELGRAQLTDAADGPSVWGPEDSMQIIKESLPVEDYYRIWDTSELPYRLSVAYCARVLSLDAAARPGQGRVRDAELRMGAAKGA